MTNNQEKKYTYSDYLNIRAKIHIELIDGVPVLEPVPSMFHRKVCNRIYAQLSKYLSTAGVDSTLCESCILRPNARDDNSDDTVLIPDIMGIIEEGADKLKLDWKSWIGVPEFIIEVSSPLSQYLEHDEKYLKYLEIGVEEYWIVDPIDQTIEVFVLKDGQYAKTEYTDSQNVPVTVWEGCTVNMGKVFQETKEKG